MSQLPPPVPVASSAAPAPAGWYADPIDGRRFRQWTGSRWTRAVYDGTALHRDDALVANLPRPRSFPAPEVPPSKRRLMTIGIGGAVGLAAVWAGVTVASTDDNGSSVGSFDDDTVDREAAACIEDFLIADADLVRRAIDASSSVGELDGNSTWSNLSESIAQLPTFDCPSEFGEGADVYVEAVGNYGSFVQDRSGLNVLDDVLNQTDPADEARTKVATINDAYSVLVDIAIKYEVDEARGSLTIKD